LKTLKGGKKRLTTNKSWAIASWHRLHFFFSRPISLNSPLIIYKVCLFESFTLSPFDKMLGSWHPEFVHTRVFMGKNETLNNNQEDFKHQICFKFHLFNY